MESMFLSLSDNIENNHDRSYALSSSLFTIDILSLTCPPLGKPIEPDNPLIPVKLGAGSFAAIYTSAGSRLAIKECHFPTDTGALETEFCSLNELYTVFTHHQSAMFKVPRPFACYRPDQNTFLRRTEDTLPQLFDIFRITTAAYAMERVPPIPAKAARILKENYLPSGYNELNQLESIHLCRLYFGKREIKVGKFVNLANFQLDLARYRKLQAGVGGLPSPGVVSYETGIALGTIHACGYDGRDIEFVLGGDGVSGFEWFVMDFNQVRD